MKHIYILILIAAVVQSCESNKEAAHVALKEIVAPLYDPELKPFYHGVASGDPLTDRVIIWTRVTPADSVAQIPVKWEVAEAKDFSTILLSDTTSAKATNDYTVKVDVKGLQPGKFYYYRFSALDKTSTIGRTKTLPSANPDSLKLAIVSCTNWEFGYFTPLDHIAARDIDAWIHLGDYIYEYQEGGYGNKNSGRKHLPSHEVVSLSDYRTRYSQYNLDKALRAVRQQHPLIAIWDDHEVANDVYKSGAQNHQQEEGDFNIRKEAAKKAYYEWIPIRQDEKLYRTFSFGDLAELIMLDERLEGRVKPLDSADDPALETEYRTMLGEEQTKWLLEKLKAPVEWKIVGNQVLFTDLKKVKSKSPKNLDSWEGYPLEKRAIADFIQKNAIKNVIFTTGDTHSSFAFELSADPFAKKTIPYAVEFGTTSVSSGNANEYAPDDSVKMIEQLYIQRNPHLKFANLRDHGYLLLTISKEQAKAEWWFVDTLLKPDSKEFLARRINIRKDNASIK